MPLRHPHTADDIATLHEKIDALTALVQHALAIQPPRTWVTVDEAAALSGFTPQCIRGWCRAHRIGVFVRGQWRVDRAQLRAHIVARFGLSRLPPELREVS
jgi:hypothetical protein